jgi:tetratricopeptide (TPR) repeat protein
LSEPAPQTIPPRFQLRRRLGEGGTGIVYEAWDSDREMPVALKLLSRVTPASIFRFKNEFRALSHVSHPNLIVLHELLSVGEQWLLVMDLVEGTDFLSHVRSGPDPRVADTVPAPDHLHELPDASGHDSDGRELEQEPLADTQRLRHALPQLVDAIDTLHQAGFLHRDIKPSNVLVDRNGHVTVLDFGLLREEDTEYQTLEERIVGTPAYMAPEQARGEGSTAASDWYGVGVILYEALTGLLPFEGPVLQVLSMKQLRDAPDPREFVESLPEDLAELTMALLRRDPHHRPRADEVRKRLAAHSEHKSSVPPAAASSGAAPFVGRSRQLEVLFDAFRTAQLGSAVLVEVHGASGVGKTALARHFLARLREERPDAVVLAGQCYERESVPYKAFDSVVDALSRYLRQLEAPEADELLPSDLVPIVRVFPVLRRVERIRAHTPSATQPTPDPHEVRRRAFAALRDLLGRIAARAPVVLFIDDLQWGDLDSAELLHDLLASPEAPPLLLLATYRTDARETSPLLRHLHEKDATLLYAPIRRELVLESLGSHESQQLAESLLGAAGSEDSAKIDAIVHEAEGNPLFLGELARFTAEHDRDAQHRIDLLGVLERRLETLSEAARELLEIVSVAGQPLEPSLAARAAGLRKQAPGAFVALQVAHLVRTSWARGQEAVEPYHDRIRDAVLQVLTPQRLQRCHLALATALEDSGAEPERLAHHLDAAGHPVHALRYLRDAAERAVQALAFDRAVQLYGRALDLDASDPTEHHQLEVALGDSLAYAGRGAEAAHTYLRAAERADSEQALELRRAAAEHLLRSGHIDEGIGVVRTVLATFGDGLAPTPRRALTSLLVQRARLRMRGLRYRERNVDDVSNALLLRIDTCWTVATGLSVVDTIQGADFQARHLRLSLHAGEPYRIARALALEAGHHATRGMSGQKRALELLDRAEALAHQLDDPHTLGLTTAVRGVNAALTFDWQTSRGLTAQADTMFRQYCQNVAWELATCMRFHFVALFFLGDIAELSWRAPDALEDANRRGDRYAAECARSGVAAAAWLAAGREEEIHQHLLQAFDRWSHRNFQLQHHLILQGLANVERYLGQPERALERIDAWRSAHNKSLLLRVQLVRVTSMYDEGACALAAAGGEHREARLRRAEAIAHRLHRERSNFAESLAFSLEAGIHYQRGSEDKALERLDAAENLFGELQMRLFAACARLLRGRLLGGDQGTQLIGEGEELMRARRIRHPERVLQTLTPGFES